MTNTSKTIEVQPLSGFKKALAYALDQKLAPRIHLGSLVIIPLGHRKTLGIVSSLTPESPPASVEKLKFVLSLVRDDPVLSPDLISLARWMSGYYATSIESVLEGMIPAAVRDGTGEKTKRMLEITKLGLTDKGKELVSRSPKQRVLLEYLSQQAGPAPLNESIKHLGVGESVAKGLMGKGLAMETKNSVKRVAYSDDLMDSADEVYAEVKLTDEQSQASKEIKDSLKKNCFSTHLLLGITGSGKTEVYFEAMEEALSMGGSVLFLVPEVALAPQTVSRLRHRFSRQGEQVVVWHSHLSAGERLDAWSSITQGNARIVVGARSAIFAPVPNLRLIVVDEEHEPAYKQDENPRYHGRDVAVYRAMLNGAVCLLGSATPSLETLHNVEIKKYSKSSLTKRIDGRELPLIHLVDMRKESLREKIPPILSQPLVEALRQRFTDREQSILFLNRRGFNTTMLCPECGFVEQCKDCSIAMTYHRTDGYLRCHLCSYRKPAPRCCPECKSFDIRKKGHGTQRIEDIVRDLLPRKTVVMRIDADMMTKKNLFREVLNDFRRGKIDVLVGTQMIAKGLDFPNVTLVGVVDADLPLRMEDFRASERAFQLLVQVGGRAGRGDRAGEVFVQTYAPHAPSIQYSRKADLHGFSEEELELRKEFGYPPYRHLIRHLFKGRSEEKVEFYAQQWRKALDATPIPQVDVKGPAPAPLEKIKGFYRYHLLYLTGSVRPFLEQFHSRRADFPLDKDVHDVIDVDCHQLS
ncbi:MAG: primosomal protein N' [Opitutae bacterium]|nr:primosomal protein N' [Opitutae bacterium]